MTIFEGARGSDPDPNGQQGAEQAEGWNILLRRAGFLQRGRVRTSAGDNSQVVMFCNGGQQCNFGSHRQ